MPSMLCASGGKGPGRLEGQASSMEKNGLKMDGEEGGRQGCGSHSDRST